MPTPGAHSPSLPRAQLTKWPYEPPSTCSALPALSSEPLGYPKDADSDRKLRHQGGCGPHVLEGQRLRVAQEGGCLGDMAFPAHVSAGLFCPRTEAFQTFTVLPLEPARHEVLREAQSCGFRGMAHPEYGQG